jgi:hypothetical protein
VSKVAKGFGKAIGGAVKGIKKVFKKVVGSKLGKIIIIAAAIYYGGAAFGQWQVGAGMPGATAVNNMGANYVAGNGMFNSAAMAAEGMAGETVAAAGSEAALTQAGGAGIPGEAQAVMANSSTVSPAAVPVQPQYNGAGSIGWDGTAGTGVEPLSAQTSAVPTPAPAAPSSLPPVEVGSPVWEAPTDFVAGSKNGMIARLLDGGKGMANWVGDNPWPAVIGLNAASALLNDEQGDAWDREDKERARRNKNLEGVAGVDLGVAPSGRPLTYSDGTPVYNGGLVGSNMRKG